MGKKASSEHEQASYSLWSVDIGGAEREQLGHEGGSVALGLVVMYSLMGWRILMAGDLEP